MDNSNELLKRDESKNTKEFMPNIKALTITDSNERATCKHCGKDGHNASTCWKITKCPKCGKTGHPEWRCNDPKSNATYDAKKSAKKNKKNKKKSNSANVAEEKKEDPKEGRTVK